MPNEPLTTRTYPGVVDPTRLHKNDSLHKLDCSESETVVDVRRPHELEYPRLGLAKDKPWLAVVAVRAPVYVYT